jgi:diguanylate cyclase (GGDEF)-like protein
VGGDEFVVVVQNKDLTECAELMKGFDMECESQFLEIREKKIPISIARGFAEYNPDNDENFADVFKRADEAMYKNKRSMKSSLYVS